MGGDDSERVRADQTHAVLADDIHQSAFPLSAFGIALRETCGYDGDGLCPLSAGLVQHLEDGLRRHDDDCHVRDHRTVEDRMITGHAEDLFMFRVDQEYPALVPFTVE